MPKKRKRERHEPNIVVFLVEGESDKIVLELPIADLITEKNPDYEVRFLLQERVVNNVGDEVADVENEEDEEESIPEIEYAYGGDITTSSYVSPVNIESKITRRFILPAVRKDGIYPKKIAKIIHIVDLDGAYIPDENIVPYSKERFGYEKLYYDDINGQIETSSIDATVLRNEHKRNNIDYLLNLPEEKIKIKSKLIPYEIYFFSSNMDHFVNNDANIKEGKLRLAREFLEEYGLDTESFCTYFLNDANSIGKLGYKESWEEVKKGLNSVKRFTNIDCLIRKLKD